SLSERWQVMQHLRGASVMAVVGLSSRPFKTAKWGVKYRPDLKILDWVKPGGDLGGTLTGPASPSPQLPPASATASSANATPETSAPTTNPVPPASQSTARPASPPPPPPPPSPPPAKPANTVKDGLSFLQPVKPVTLREEMDDEITF